MYEINLGPEPAEDNNSIDVVTNESKSLLPAKTSTGPRTENGKAIASKNALKHGIFSSVILLTSESRSDYESLVSGLSEYHKPEGTLEEILVERLAVLTWRHRRLLIAERAELAATDFPMKLPSNDSNILNRFPRYEANIDRAFDRTLTQLERHQRMRLGQPVVPPIKLDISGE